MGQHGCHIGVAQLQQERWHAKRAGISLCYRGKAAMQHAEHRVVGLRHQHRAIARQGGIGASLALALFTVAVSALVFIEFGRARVGVGR